MNTDVKRNSRLQWRRPGIDHFGAPFLSPPLALKVGPIQYANVSPPRGSGSGVSSPVGAGEKPQPPTILVHFEDLETLLMTSKMSFHAHPCLNRAHIIYVYFVSQKLPHPLSATPSAGRPGQGQEGKGNMPRVRGHIPLALLPLPIPAATARVHGP